MADSLALSSPLVLVVGPDRHSREPYALCAAAADLRVEQAHNALQALDKATALRPDVILTDLALTYGLDGIALCRRLGVEASTKSIPILAVARDHPTEIAEATAAGCAAVLVKPCSPERLLVEIIWVLVRTRNDGPLSGPTTIRFLTRSLRNALDKNARLATENADLTASALLWADWYGRAAERARQDEAELKVLRERAASAPPPSRTPNRGAPPLSRSFNSGARLQSCGADSTD